MPLFIVVNLLLSFFAQDEGLVKEVLLIPLLMYICIGIASICLALSVVKKCQRNITFDLFASSIALVWFSYWQPYFKDDAPMFFIYPVYFAMLTAIISLVVNGHHTRVDKHTFVAMQAFSSRVIIQPWIIMSCLFISIALYQNFLFFPTMMTLMVIRYALTSYLNKQII